MQNLAREGIAYLQGTFDPKKTLNFFRYHKYREETLIFLVFSFCGLKFPVNIIIGEGRGGGKRNYSQMCIKEGVVAMKKRDFENLSPMSTF